MGLPLRLAGRPAAERHKAVTAQLARVGLMDAADAFPAQLSGGMRQRAAIARAMVGRPAILLMDEPFASVEAQTRELMQVDLMDLWQADRPTVLFVTHSVEEAVLLGDRVVVLGG
ncbi:ATP-binding cassette domain-containing protein [Palleronia sp.]|uniref:ATP-binding cassette domain-containing protein n=1 Tax=Palleronia sp. TaxID=1940284 RepID=UPI0035C8695A